jgi:hypothetical protein
MPSHAQCVFSVMTCGPLAMLGFSSAMRDSESVDRR